MTNKQQCKVRCLNTWLDFHRAVLPKSSSNNSTQAALKINAINFACKCWVRRKKNQTNKRTIFYFLDWSLPPTLLPISNHTNSSELKSQSKKYWLCSTYAFPAVEDNLRTHLNTNLPLKTSFCFEVPVLCCKGCSLRDQLVYNQK